MTTGNTNKAMIRDEKNLKISCCNESVFVSSDRFAWHPVHGVWLVVCQIGFVDGTS